MDTLNGILRIIDESGGKLKSRTALQKIAYFATKHGCFKAEFRPHYYGPYSREVSSKTAMLQSMGFIEERTVTLGPQADPWLAAVSGDVKAYSYALTEEGRKVLEEIGSRDDHDWMKLREVVEVCKTVNCSPGMLSVAAKLDFLMRHSQGGHSLEECKETASRFGWKLTDDQISAAVDFLVDMRSLKQSDD